MIPTHEVIDLVYEGQDDVIDEVAFSGSFVECEEFIKEQGDDVWLYEIRPIIQVRGARVKVSGARVRNG